MSRSPFKHQYLSPLLLAITLTAVLICSPQLLHSHKTPLPVLMYHHIDQDVSSDMTVSPARFEEQIAALTQDGWHSVTIAQLIDYVNHGTPLPPKPVLITFDDGYASNLELAAPILERYGQHGIIFVIGINAGQTHYPHTGQPLTPARFALEDAAPYLESGVLELQSHTFDLHQRASYGISGREGVLPLPQEAEDAYRQILFRDTKKQQALFHTHLGTTITALAYPFGFSCSQSEQIFTTLGIRATFTTTPGSNTVYKNKPETLHLLSRYTMTNRMAAEDILWLLSQS